MVNNSLNRGMRMSVLVASVLAGGGRLIPESFVQPKQPKTLTEADKLALTKAEAKRDRRRQKRLKQASLSATENPNG